MSKSDLLSALKGELPGAVRELQRSNIAPVDLAQAAIGPGMSVYTRYGRVLDAAGKPIPVRDALALINQTLDEVLAEQEGDFDAASRWALGWFEQYGFSAGEYGIAEVLSKAKNTSISSLVHDRIVTSKAGKVKLLAPSEMADGWDLSVDGHSTSWDVVHRLIRALEIGGESRAGHVWKMLGSKTDVARELAYRLFTICEKKKLATEARSYNGLVQSLAEISRLAREVPSSTTTEPELFEQE